jgi:hypothetical protein
MLGPQPLSLLAEYERNIRRGFVADAPPNSKGGEVGVRFQVSELAPMSASEMHRCKANEPSLFRHPTPDT